MEDLFCLGEAGGTDLTTAFSSGRACFISLPAKDKADGGWAPPEHYTAAAHVPQMPRFQFVT